jgi:ApeA N-terminal domain 1
MDSIEYRGFWWLPDNPEKTVAGFLTFSQQKGGKLELIGAFSSMFEGASDNYPIILGMTIDGKPVTLQRCLETGRVATTSGTETTDYLVHFIFVGDHIESEDSLRFNKLQAKFTYLYDWVGVTGISRKVLEKGQKYQVTYETPEDISIAVPDGKLDITFGANIKSGYDISNIKEKSSIFIEFAEDKTFYEFSRNYLFPLQALIRVYSEFKQANLFNKPAILTN